MRKLTTGQDSTLGNYLKHVLVFFGDGPAARFLRKKIADSPNGENEEVLADESQMIQVLFSIEQNEKGE